MIDFITIPLVIGTGELPKPGDAIPDVEEKVVMGKLNRQTIAAYHPGYFWGTFIYITSGQVLLTRLDMTDFEKLL